MDKIDDTILGVVHDKVIEEIMTTQIVAAEIGGETDYQSGYIAGLRKVNAIMELLNRGK